MAPSRTLFITPAKAEMAADLRLISGSARHAEIIPGRQREDDRSVSIGWFVRVFDQDGKTAYL